MQVSPVLQKLLSNERLVGYSSEYAKSKHSDPIALYLWNLSLAETFYPLLHTVEIGLRNSISNAICTHYNDSDWLFRPDFIELIDRYRVEQTIKNLKKCGKEVNVNNIIADLNLGFWVSLLDKRYEQKLWHKICKQTFPNMPRKIRTRKTASKRFSSIREIRNRIFHFEPIWHWKNLPQHHDYIIEAIEWINPTLKVFIQQERFIDIYYNGLAYISKNLKTYNARQSLSFQEVEN